MSTEDDYYWDILEELDGLDRDFSQGEEDFMEYCWQWGNLGPRQKVIIEWLKEKYLVRKKS